MLEKTKHHTHTIKTMHAQTRIIDILYWIRQKPEKKQQQQHQSDTNKITDNK